MITQSIRDHIFSSVCAIGYLAVPMEEYRRDPKKPFLEVLGTGFLVRETTVMTNRHVIESKYGYSNLWLPLWKRVAGEQDSLQ